MQGGGPLPIPRIEVGMASALLSFSETASHRVYIVLAGLMGCAGILCASFLQHLQRAAFLMAAILVTHMLAAQLKSAQSPYHFTPGEVWNPSVCGGDDLL